MCVCVCVCVCVCCAVKSLAMSAVKTLSTHTHREAHLQRTLYNEKTRQTRRETEKDVMRYNCLLCVC